MPTFDYSGYRKWSYLIATFEWHAYEWRLHDINDKVPADDIKGSSRYRALFEIGALGFELVSYTITPGNNFATALFKREEP